MSARHGPLARHTLLRVDPRCWLRILERTAAHAEDIAQWAVRGWPLIVRRYLPDEGREIIPAAAPLPPTAAQGRRAGVVLRLLEEEVLHTIDAVTLPAALAAAPAAWQPAMHALISLGEECASVPALYGSLLWQLLTGMSYVTARSDLDLCWRVDSVRQAKSLTEGLARIERVSPMRLDGELLLPDGGAIAWREYVSAPADPGRRDELLVKTLHGVDSRPRAWLFGQAA